MDTTPETNLTPADAVAYIRERHGEAATPTEKYLEKLRTVGGGPKFLRIGRRIAYRPRYLDEWIASRTSRPLSSTSEAA